MRADLALLEAIQALNTSLEDLGASAMIIGGVAVIARGVPRTTIDLDATVWGEDVFPSQILKIFAQHGIEARIPNVEAFAERSQILLLVHQPTGTGIDLSLAWLPFEKAALERATEVRIGSARFLAATAEDLVIYKAVAWRDRDRDDIENLLLLHREAIDLGRVRALVEEFSIVLEDPERIHGFDEILRRVAAIAAEEGPEEEK